MTRRRFIKLAAASSLAGGSSLRLPTFAAAQLQPAPFRDVIVLIPGLLCSQLLVNGKPAWAAASGSMEQILYNFWKQSDALAMSGDSAEAEDLGDGVTVAGLVPGFRIFPGFWKVGGYANLHRRLSTAFKLVRQRNYFEFAYDWRRDNRATARRLQRMSREWLSEWRSSSGNADAKLVLISHSMGVLIARYFLEVLGGWRDTKASIVIGGTHLGTMKALDFISNGFHRDALIRDPAIQRAFHLSDLAETARSFTSVYQMCPAYDFGVAIDGHAARFDELVGLPNLDVKRASQALEIYDEISRQETENLRSTDYVRYRTFAVVGIGQKTMVSARIEDGRLVPVRIGGSNGGDGTAPRVSAEPVQGTSFYLAQKHSDLQNSAVACDQIRRVLLDEAPVFVEAVGPTIEFDMDDIQRANKPIPIQVRASHFPRGATLFVRITDAETNRPVSPATALRAANTDGDYSAVVAPLSKGAYRAWIGSDYGNASVTELFATF